MCWTVGWSQAFCQFVAEGTGVVYGKKLFHLDKAWYLSGYGSDGRWLGSSCCIRSEAPSADVKRQMVQEWRHYGIQGRLIWLGGLPAAMSCYVRNQYCMVILETMDFRRGSYKVVHDRASPVTVLSHPPSSLRKSLDLGPMVPPVSKATGLNRCMLSSEHTSWRCPLQHVQQLLLALQLLSIIIIHIKPSSSYNLLPYYSLG